MRSRILIALLLSGAFAFVASTIPGCNCDKNGTNCFRGVCYGDMGVPMIGSITISPPDVTLDLVQGQPPQMQAFTVTFHGNSGDSDVTSQSTFALGDPTIGTMNGNTFTCGTAHGGSTFLTATYTPKGMAAQQATATIHVRVKGSFTGPDCMGGGCGTFPPDSAPACTQTGITPNIVYPPDGVLLPPNMEVVSVMWKPFPGGPPALPIQKFEVDFSNSNTDVRILTKCSTQTMDTGQPAPSPSGGCELQLDQNMWDFIAKSNRGGDNVTITVRATTDGTCATKSMNTTHIAFAQDDVNGGIYYWKSTVSAAGTGGQIWAKQFGNMIPEEQITGVNGLGSTCNGCHSLSRDGKFMTINMDDNDSDDEYSDVRSGLVDVKAKMLIGGGNQPPGFQAFYHDDSMYMGSNGKPTGASNVFFLYNGMTGAALAPPSITVGAAGERPTQPDWSADGKTVLYVKPGHVGAWNNTFGQPLTDDDHVFGGSIMSMSYDPASKMFGTPKVVIPSTGGDNNYYPGLSPDGGFIVYNHVPMQTFTPSTNPDCTGTGLMTTCPNDSFSNIKARVWILSTKAGSMPVDAEKANGSPASAPVDVSNSWPRWSPFVQTYKGSKLLWVTFSSTRDYGLRVLNHKTGMFQCYPSDSLEQAGGAHGVKFDNNCQQPQIWMAAINLSTAEVSTGGDPSYPAFWLPFQDITTHNHTAQWTQAVVSQPQPDMGTCIADGQNCMANPNGCCAPDYCTPQGVCGSPIP